MTVLAPLIYTESTEMFVCFRYTIKEIINHPFFQEDSGVKVNLVEPEPGVDSDHTKPVDTVKLLLQLEDPKKRKDKHKENEGIQFDFNLGTDQPEKVTQELVSNHFVFTNPILVNVLIIPDIFVSQLKQVGACTVMYTQEKLKIFYLSYFLFDLSLVIGLAYLFSVLPSVCCSTLMIINL